MNSIHKVKLLAEDLTFSVSEASAITSLFSEHGVNPDALLRGSGVLVEALHDPHARISLTQQLCIEGNALRLGGIPALGTAIGRRLHLTAYGILGYALLSSTTLDHALTIAENYAPLLSMKFKMHHEKVGNEAIIRLENELDLDRDQKTLAMEIEIAKIMTLLGDLLGEQFKSTRVATGMSDALRNAGGIQWLPHSYAGDASCGEIRFDAQLLQHSLPQAHVATNRSCLEICDGIIEGLKKAIDLPQHVERMLLNTEGQLATLSQVADRLCMSPRTLRRRLECLDTSYAKILEVVRKALAIRYLEKTSLTMEIIAEQLGYSDAANFRHAFKRWTGQSPRQFKLEKLTFKCVDSALIVATERTHPSPTFTQWAREPEKYRSFFQDSRTDQRAMQA